MCLLIWNLNVSVVWTAPRVSSAFPCWSVWQKEAVPSYAQSINPVPVYSRCSTTCILWLRASASTRAQLSSWYPSWPHSASNVLRTTIPRRSVSLVTILDDNVDASPNEEQNCRISAVLTPKSDSAILKTRECLGGRNLTNVWPSDTPHMAFLWNAVITIYWINE